LGQKFGGTSLQKNGGPKTSKFWQDYGLRDLIANISGLQQDTVDRKTALQTAITAVHRQKSGVSWLVSLGSVGAIAPNFLT